jgi:hypothetical protein
MVSMAVATRLKSIRESLHLTQEMVSRRTRSIGLRTYIRAETGKKVTYGTAMDILDAINTILEENKREKVALDDLGLTLY